jgi:hypothetical protein
MESSETWLRTEFRLTAYNYSCLVNWGKNQKDGLKDTKTNSTGQSPFREVITQVLKKFLAFMEPEGS